MKTLGNTVKFTSSEISYLEALIEINENLGEYWGNKAQFEKRRESVKEKLLELRKGLPKKVIYRCGFCGFPVKKDGTFIKGMTPEKTHSYLERNRNRCSNTINVNGECCPEGDEE
jgi:hypothetical protein